MLINIRDDSAKKERIRQQRPISDRHVANSMRVKERRAMPFTNEMNKEMTGGKEGQNKAKRGPRVPISHQVCLVHK